MREKRLVVTMACGETSRRYLEFTGPLIQKYAQKCNADFLTIHTEVLGYPSIGYQKWQYYKLLQVYDRILHVDADMVVRSTTPDLFKTVPKTHFGAVDELPFQNLDVEVPPIDRIKDLNKYCKYHTSDMYLNVGLMLFDTTHATLFHKKPDMGDWYFKEQTEINHDVHFHKYPLTLLPPEFNFMKLMENAGLDKSKAHIIHYAGAWNGLSVDQVLELMKEDYA